MKLSQLIQNLQKQLDSAGDVNVEIDVKDFYTSYGNRATILESANNWNFTSYVDAVGHVIINANLKKDINGANPKITFRK
jgi:hypothetical protein